MAKIERTKNASRNIVFGVILKAYQIFVPFLMRTAMIYLMGVQYLGLNSLFTSILQVLNLAESGVGSAMVFGMYKPIAEDDNITICALMKLYRNYYRVIGLVIAVVGCALTPFIPNLIKSDIPAGINIYILYLLNLILVQFIGIYGILLSTVLAILCVGMPWLLHNLFTVIFEKKHIWHFIGRLVKYSFVVLISCVVTYFICSRFSIGLIHTILIRGLICFIVPNLIYYLTFRKTEEFRQTLQLVDKMTKGKMNKVLLKLGME